MAMLRGETGLRVVADVEALPFAGGTLDLVVSAFALETANDLPGALIQIRRALKPDGLFLAAMLGGDTLTELRESFAVAESELAGGVSPRVAPFPDLRDMGALLQRAGFALPVADVDRVVARYPSPLALMADLRRMGAANPLVERHRLPLRREVLARMMEVYADRFADADGKVRASFDIIWLSGWAPHESQQQPLRPGLRPGPARRCAGHPGDRCRGEAGVGGGGYHNSSSLCDPRRTNSGVRLAIDENQVGFDVAVAAVVPLAAEGMVIVAQWQAGVGSE